MNNDLDPKSELTNNQTYQLQHEDCVMNEGRPYPAQGNYPSKSNAHEAQQTGEQCAPTADLMEYIQQYTREKPEMVALWCLGIGFVLGWKLKPW
jgi:hypothetical protein